MSITVFVGPMRERRRKQQRRRRRPRRRSRGRMATVIGTATPTEPATVTALMVDKQATPDALSALTIASPPPTPMETARAKAKPKPTAQTMAKSTATVQVTAKSTRTAPRTAKASLTSTPTATPPLPEIHQQPHSGQEPRHSLHRPGTLPAHVRFRRLGTSLSRSRVLRGPAQRKRRKELRYLYSACYLGATEVSTRSFGGNTFAVVALGCLLELLEDHVAHGRLF